VRFTARPEFANPIGVVQGGFLAAMLDDTLGPALQSHARARTSSRRRSSSRSTSCAPAKTGLLIAEGRVVARGGSIAFLAGELRTEGGDARRHRRRATARIVVPRDGFAEGSSE
jgi:acyl-coenzyme A thioesterase PaaI-like protein